MIASIQGKVLSQGKDALVLNLAGLGIRVFVPADLLVQPRIGDDLHLHLVHDLAVEVVDLRVDHGPK